MNPVEKIVHEAEKLPTQQLREITAMAKGMEAANRIAQERGA